MGGSSVRLRCGVTEPVCNLWVISRRSRSNWLRLDVSVKGHFISQGSVFFQLLLREKGKRDFSKNVLEYLLMKTARWSDGQATPISFKTRVYLGFVFCCRNYFFVMKETSNTFFNFFLNLIIKF